MRISNQSFVSLSMHLVRSMMRPPSGVNLKAFDRMLVSIFSKCMVSSHIVTFWLMCSIVNVICLADAYAVNELQMYSA